MEIHSFGEAKARRFGVNKVEILYFDGCPTYKAVEKTLWKGLAEEGIDAEVELVTSTPTRRPSGSGPRKPDDPVG